MIKSPYVVNMVVVSLELRLQTRDSRQSCDSKKGLLTMEATVKVVSRDPVPDVGREHLQSETKGKMKTERGRGARCTGSPGQCQTS